jgi:hypothetical protein
MNRFLALILSLIVVVGVAACGGDSSSSSSSGSAVLDVPTIEKNLSAKGYGLKPSTKNLLPASLGSFAVDPAKGFKSSHYVTGKGLKEADGLTVEGVVTILVFKDEASAKEAFTSLGGETLNRKQVGNRIYLWGGGTSQTKPSPQLATVVGASSGTD